MTEKQNLFAWNEAIQKLQSESYQRMTQDNYDQQLTLNEVYIMAEERNVVWIESLDKSSVCRNGWAEIWLSVDMWGNDIAILWWTGMEREDRVKLSEYGKTWLAYKTRQKSKMHDNLEGCDYCNLDVLHEVVCYIPLSNGDGVNMPYNFCANCGRKLNI